jgi:hypothetical protein
MCNILFYCLALLDGKQISNTTREFLKRLEINKAGHKMASNQTHVNSTLPADIMGEFWIYLWNFN